jgi:hypothetical protein
MTMAGSPDKQITKKTESDEITSLRRPASYMLQGLAVGSVMNTPVKRFP